MIYGHDISSLPEANNTLEWKKGKEKEKQGYIQHHLRKLSAHQLVYLPHTGSWIQQMFLGSHQYNSQYNHCVGICTLTDVQHLLCLLLSVENIERIIEKKCCTKITKVVVCEKGNSLFHDFNICLFVTRIQLEKPWPDVNHQLTRVITNREYLLLNELLKFGARLGQWGTYM